MVIQGWLALLLGALALVGFVVVGAALLKFVFFIVVMISDALKPAAKAVASVPKNQA